MSEEVQEIEAEEVVEAVEEEAPLPTVEELAAELGWKPKDQWKGDPGKWRPPVEYIKHGQNDTVVKKLSALERSHEQILRTTAATTERLLREQEAEINARWQQAVDDGDHKAVRAAERELLAVEQQRNQPDPIIAEFEQRNAWYGTDPDATDMAAAVSARLARQGKSVSEQLEAAERAVRARFPEHFEAAPSPPARRQAPQVHAPGSRTAAPTQRDPLAGIPREHVAQGQEMVKMAQSRGMKYTIEDWAKTYRKEMGIAA
jgi:hypothetical protein